MFVIEDSRLLVGRVLFDHQRYVVLGIGPELVQLVEELFGDVLVQH